MMETEPGMNCNNCKYHPDTTCTHPSPDVVVEVEAGICCAMWERENSG
jgi:hypothetical protein